LVDDVLHCLGYKVQAIDAMSFHVEDGEFVTSIEPSGAISLGAAARWRDRTAEEMRTCRPAPANAILFT
jgi:hypothetical protein